MHVSLATVTTVTKQTIDAIISTYDLPPNVSDRIARAADAYRREFDIHDFNALYTHIGTLVDLENAPSHKSLDQPLRPGTTITLRDTLAAPTPQDTPSTRPLQAIYKDIMYLLNTKARKTLRQLIPRDHDIHLPTPTCIPADLARRIQPRLIALHDRYARNGRLQIPPRPILWATAEDDITIKFKPRRYHDDPLRFLQSHPEYAGLTRGELYHYDQGLYQSLKLAGQLRHVPTKRQRFLTHTTPDDYFTAHPHLIGLTKAELEKRDSRAYSALRTRGILDKYTVPHQPTYRGYDGPLAYFKAHETDFAGITKTELSLRDPGLYRALARRKEVHLALPHDRPPGRKTKRE